MNVSENGNSTVIVNPLDHPVEIPQREQSTLSNVGLYQVQGTNYLLYTCNPNGGSFIIKLPSGKQQVVDLPETPTTFIANCGTSVAQQESDEVSQELPPPPETDSVKTRLAALLRKKVLSKKDRTTELGEGAKRRTKKSRNNSPATSNSNVSTVVNPSDETSHDCVVTELPSDQQGTNSQPLPPIQLIKENLDQYSSSPFSFPPADDLAKVLLMLSLGVKVSMEELDDVIAFVRYLKETNLISNSNRTKSQNGQPSGQPAQRSKLKCPLCRKDLQNEPKTSDPAPRNFEIQIPQPPQEPCHVEKKSSLIITKPVVPAPPSTVNLVLPLKVKVVEGNKIAVEPFSLESGDVSLPAPLVTPPNIPVHWSPPYRATTAPEAVDIWSPPHRSAAPDAVDNSSPPYCATAAPDTPANCSPPYCATVASDVPANCSPPRVSVKDPRDAGNSSSRSSDAPLIRDSASKRSIESAVGKRPVTKAAIRSRRHRERQKRLYRTFGEDGRLLPYKPNPEHRLRITQCVAEGRDWRPLAKELNIMYERAYYWARCATSTPKGSIGRPRKEQPQQSQGNPSDPTTCDMCGDTFMLRVFKRHLAKCNRVLVRSHQRREPSAEGAQKKERQCPKCPEKVTEDADFEMHMAVAHKYLWRYTFDTQEVFQEWFHEEGLDETMFGVNSMYFYCMKNINCGADVSSWCPCRLTVRRRPDYVDVRYFVLHNHAELEKKESVTDECNEMIFALMKRGFNDYDVQKRVLAKYPKSAIKVRLNLRYIQKRRVVLNRMMKGAGMRKPLISKGTPGEQILSEEDEASEQETFADNVVPSRSYEQEIFFEEEDSLPQNEFSDDMTPTKERSLRHESFSPERKMPKIGRESVGHATPRIKQPRLKESSTERGVSHRRHGLPSWASGQRESKSPQRAVSFSSELTNQRQEQWTYSDTQFPRLQTPTRFDLYFD